MSLSLEGGVADQNGNAGRLSPGLAALRHAAYEKDDIGQNGAFLIGRGRFKRGDPDSNVGNCEFQVPIFMLTDHPPGVAPKQVERLIFTIVADGLESAVVQAIAAAGDKAVPVAGGFHIAQQLLAAGLVDELGVDLLPVFLGPGLRSFESSGLERVRLEKIDVQEVGGRASF